MKGFWEIFVLEWRALVRSKAMLMLTAFSLAWMFLAPHIFRADGTAEGARELCVRFSLGGVATLLAVSLVITAAGSISRERKAKRLQLTMVRPIRFFAIAFGKIAALTFAGAIILALAAAVEVARQDPGRHCNSVYRPILPSPKEEAAQMYDAYMADPETPDAVKKAKKSVVMRLLTQRAIDHYQTIPTNSTATWHFTLNPQTPTTNPQSPTPNLLSPPPPTFSTSSLLTPHFSLLTSHSSLLTSHSSLLTTHYSLRLRFTNMYNMRDEVRGSITSSFGAIASVSNITQAIVTIPLTTNPQPSTLNPTKRLASSTPNPQPPTPITTKRLASSTPNPQPPAPITTKRLASSTLDLSFSNSGSRAVMLRPRKDIELLVRADNFLNNLIRAYLELVSILAVLIAFGVFLGAALSRPVAIFVAVVTLALSEMSPSVIEQYPDELETSRIDAIGLSLARFATAVTHPIGSLSPLSELAADNRIEPRHVARTLLANCVLLPFALALLSAAVIPRKKED